MKVKMSKTLRNAVLLTCYGAAPYYVMRQTGVSPRRVKKALIVIQREQNQKRMMNELRVKEYARSRVHYF